MKTMPAFGEFFKVKRQALGLTLREFCLKHKLDPGNLSRMERGLLAPPQNRLVPDVAHMTLAGEPATMLERRRLREEMIR